MANSLSLINDDLAAQLDHASTDQLRQIAYSVSDLAIKHCALDKEPAVGMAQEELRSAREGPEGDQSVQADLAELAARNDADYFARREAQEEYQEPFARARALLSLLNALGPDPLEAAAGSVYEARFAVDGLEPVRKKITDVLASR